MPRRELTRRVRLRLRVIASAEPPAASNRLRNFSVGVLASNCGVPLGATTSPAQGTGPSGVKLARSGI